MSPRVVIVGQEGSAVDIEIANDDQFTWPATVERSGEDRRQAPREGTPDRRHAPESWSRGYHDGLDGRTRQAPLGFGNVESQRYYDGHTSGELHRAFLASN